MIHQTLGTLPNPNWQQALANAIKDPKVLLSQLGLTDRLNAIDPELIPQFPLRVTQSYINKMHYGDPNDPLLRQVFPLIDEQLTVSGFKADPVGDHQAIVSPGVLKKYSSRALLLTTGACAIHCRYCFRRHFPYQESNPLVSQWPATLESIKRDKSIQEVILSGGDPLVLGNSKLSTVITDLSSIESIKRLRIHTRLPIVLPERIDQDLLTLLADTSLQVIMVIHANHANELAEDVAMALNKLRHSGVQLLNQSVLLKGINDKVDTLVNLSERLIELAVMPYYLHLLDPVAGASHFDVEKTIAIDLIEQLRSRISGYLVPRLVQEIAGSSSKTIIA